MSAEVFLMSESFWESEVAEEAKPEPLPQAPAAEPEALSLSVDEFSALEERIRRTVTVVKQERLARAAADERAAKAEAQLHEQQPLVAQLQKELTALNTERDQIRQRIERLLAQLDSLEL
jgi:septal ring factor EnvC (AmiA/AmiB activator)